MGSVWCLTDNSWWVTLENLAKATRPARQLLETIQADATGVVRALDLVLPVLKELPLAFSGFARAN